MRFLALFRKELREALPWLLLAAVVMLAIGGLNVLGQMRMAERGHYWYPPQENSVMGYGYDGLQSCDLADLAPLLLLTSCGLGLVLAARQFFLPTLLKEWPFTLHRSTTRLAVLLAKLTAAGVAFVVGIGVVWTVLYLWASRPGALVRPVPSRVYWEGGLYLLLGVVAYVAGASASVSKAKWYTTRLFPLALAWVIICLVVNEWHMAAVLAILLVGLTILGIQLVLQMLDREF